MGGVPWGWGLVGDRTLCGYNGDYHLWLGIMVLNLMGFPTTVIEYEKFRACIFHFIQLQQG